MHGGQRDEFEDHEPGPIRFGSGESLAPSASESEAATPLLPPEAMVSFEPDELPPPPTLKAIKQALKRAEPPPPPEKKRAQVAKPAAPAAPEPLLYGKDLAPLAPPDEPRVPPHQRNLPHPSVRSDHPALAPLPTVPLAAPKPQLPPDAPTPPRRLGLRELLSPQPPAPLPPTLQTVELLDDELALPTLARNAGKPPLISVPAAIIIGCLTGVIVGGVIALALLPRNPATPALPAPPAPVAQAPAAANALAVSPPAKAATPVRKARARADYPRPADTVADQKLMPLRKVAPSDKVRRLDLDRLASDIQPAEEAPR